MTGRARVGNRNEGGHVWPEIGERFECPRYGLYRFLDRNALLDIRIWQSHASEWRTSLLLDEDAARAVHAALTTFLERFDE